MKLTQIDKWDFLLIRSFKMCDGKIETVLAIWEDRCALPQGYAKLADINRHLLLLAKNLGLFDNDFIFDDFMTNLAPENNWKYMGRGRDLTENTVDYHKILLTRLDSLFSHTESKKLPGYQEHLNSILHDSTR